MSGLGSFFEELSEGWDNAKVKIRENLSDGVYEAIVKRIYFVPEKRSAHIEIDILWNNTKFTRTKNYGLDKSKDWYDTVLSIFKTDLKTCGAVIDKSIMDIAFEEIVGNLIGIRLKTKKDKEYPEIYLNKFLKKGIGDMVDAGLEKEETPKVNIPDDDPFNTAVPDTPKEPITETKPKENWSW